MKLVYLLSVSALSLVSPLTYAHNQSEEMPLFDERELWRPWVSDCNYDYEAQDVEGLCHQLRLIRKFLQARLPHVNHEEIWADLLDSIECTRREVNRLPESYADTQAILARALRRVIDSIGGCEESRSLVVILLELEALLAQGLLSQSSLESRLDAFVADAGAQFDTMENALAALSAQSDELHSNLEAVQQSVDMVQASLQDFVQNFPVGSVSEKIESRLDILSASLALTGTVVDMVQASLMDIADTAQNNFAQSQSSLSMLETRLDDLNFQVGSSGSALEQIQMHLLSLSDSIDTAGLGQSLLDSLDSRIEGLATGLLSTGSAVDLVQMNVGSLNDAAVSNASVLDVVQMNLSSLSELINTSGFGSSAFDVLQSRTDEFASLTESHFAQSFSASDMLQSNVSSLSDTIMLNSSNVEILQMSFASFNDGFQSNTDSVDSKIGNLDAESLTGVDFTSVADIDNSTLTVIEWLKTIYRELRGDLS